MATKPNIHRYTHTFDVSKTNKKGENRQVRLLYEHSRDVC